MRPGSASGDTPVFDETTLPDPYTQAVDRVALRLVAGAWSFAEANRAHIAAGWAARKAANPSLFNGRFFILNRFRLTRDVLDGECVETVYASFLHWRAGGYGGAAWNAFAMAAIHDARDRLLVGKMAGWTANPGSWYPPAGSLEASDLQPDGRFDLIGNMRRELAEEIGWTPPLLTEHGAWTLIAIKGRLAMMRRIDLPEDPDPFVDRIRRHLTAETRAELDDVAFIGRDERTAFDIPDYLRAYLNVTREPG
jgi:8-oxo-dGTP pyrophosphatase MutT (NUDIX family)